MFLQRYLFSPIILYQSKSFPLCMKSTLLYVFLPDDVFVPCNYGLDFAMSLLSKQSINFELIG